MRLFLLQTGIHPDPASIIRERLQQVALDGSGYSLAVLPELFHTGYSGLPDSALAPGHGLITEMAGLTAANGKLLLAGSLALQTPGGLVNTMMVFAGGRALPVYEKLHLFKPMNEDRFFRPGRLMTILDLHAGGGTWRIGFAICYDLRFPELFRYYARLGCSLVVVVAQWPSPRLSAWSTLLAARAAENQYFVAGVNRTGYDGSVHFGGGSAVYDPAGQKLALAGPEEELLAVTLEPATLTESRALFHSLADTRDELYRLEWTATPVRLTWPPA